MRADGTVSDDVDLVANGADLVPKFSVRGFGARDLVEVC